MYSIYCLLWNVSSKMMSVQGTTTLYLQLLFHSIVQPRFIQGAIFIKYIKFRTGIMKRSKIYSPFSFFCLFFDKGTQKKRPSSRFGMFIDSLFRNTNKLFFQVDFIFIKINGNLDLYLDIILRSKSSLVQCLTSELLQIVVHMILS